jgi:hypothetical protein
MLAGWRWQVGWPRLAAAGLDAEEAMSGTRWARTGARWLANLLLGLGATAIGFAAARAGEVPRIEIVAFGIYAPSAEHGPLPAKYRQDSIVDVSLTGMPRLIERTDRIEARACTRFGLQYRAVNFASNQSIVAEMRVEHPALTRPDGRRSNVDTYEIPVSGGIGWTGLDFKEAWEMVPGTWIFAVRYGGQVMAEQRFTVVAAPPGAGRNCVHAITGLPSRLSPAGWRCPGTALCRCPFAEGVHCMQSGQHALRQIGRHGSPEGPQIVIHPGISSPVPAIRRLLNNSRPNGAQARAEKSEAVGAVRTGEQFPRVTP